MAVHNKSYDQWLIRFNLIRKINFFYSNRDIRRFTNCLKDINSEKYLHQYFEQYPEDINLKLIPFSHYVYDNNVRQYHNIELSLVQVVAKFFHKIKKISILDTLIKIGFDIVDDLPVISLLLRHENYDIDAINYILSQMTKINIEQQQRKNICKMIYTSLIQLFISSVDFFGDYTYTHVFDSKKYISLELYFEIIDKCVYLINLIKNSKLLDTLEYFKLIHRTPMLTYNGFFEKLMIINIMLKINRYDDRKDNQDLSTLTYLSGRLFRRSVISENDTDHLLIDTIKRIILYKKMIITHEHISQLKSIKYQLLYHMGMLYLSFNQQLLYLSWGKYDNSIEDLNPFINKKIIWKKMLTTAINSLEFDPK